jgi:transposase
VSRAWIAGGHCQPALLPVDARDLLPADHPALAIEAMVGEFDLSAFDAAYRRDGRGRPPFHPRMMLTLILYGRTKRLTSGRQIAAACHDDLGARMITGNRYPHRSTIDRFLDTHQAAIRALLPQTLRLGHAEDLVDITVVAGDGTSIQANAAMDATVSEADLLTRITELETQLAAAQQAWAGQVDTEATQVSPDLFGHSQTDQRRSPPGGSAVALRRRVCTLTNLLADRKAALAYLREHPASALTSWQDKQARDQQRIVRAEQRVEQIRARVAASNQRRATAEGHRGGRPPVPPEEHNKVRRAKNMLQAATERAQATTAAAPVARVNTTDPTSRIMPGKNSGYDQRYNIQALAAPNQIVLAIGTHPNTTDNQALPSLLRQARANLDAAGITDPIGIALFDAGYPSQANFTAELPAQLLLVAVEKEARQTGRLQDDTSTAAATWQAMADRLNDPAHHQLYKRRAGIIEPLFAQLFARFGRYLHPRGEQVDTELHLWAVTHNLLKISRLSTTREK